METYQVRQESPLDLDLLVRAPYLDLVEFKASIFFFFLFILTLKIIDKREPKNIYIVSYFNLSSLIIVPDLFLSYLCCAYLVPLVILC